MAEEEEYEEEPIWIRIHEPPIGVISDKQEDAIRRYALSEGYEDLRGYHMHLRSLGWDYYDVLKAVYPR